MKVVIAVALAWGVLAVSPISAPAATEETPTAQAGSTPAADFGSPPSGAIPILYNDRHVYATPDTLKQGRVLAALARGGTIYVPLRSMFEQMGASVSFDPAGRTATISKPGAEVVVTVGKPVVIVNGESRPLDVPPIVYHGVVLVPIRVISEGMGAYVQWVPDRRLVVVRYVPPTPPPTEAPPRLRRPSPRRRLRRRSRRPIHCVSADSSARTTSRGRTHRTIPEPSSTSRRAQSTTHNARQPGDVEQRDRRARRLQLPRLWAGTSAARISMPIRWTVRASWRRTISRTRPRRRRTACSRFHRTPIPTTRFRALR